MLRIMGKGMVGLVLCGMVAGCQYGGIGPWGGGDLGTGRGAFLAADYEGARAAFNRSLGTDRSRGEQALARQALACVDMVQAGDVHAFLGAFQRAGSGPVLPENRELMIPAMSRGIFLLEKQTAADAGKIRQQQRKIRNQQAELKKLKALARVLQHQIASLERIDSEAQEKR